MKEKLIEFLLNLSFYNDYYAGPVIDEIIDHLDNFFESLNSPQD